MKKKIILSICLVMMLLGGSVFANSSIYLYDTSWDLSINGEKVPIYENENTHYIKVNILTNFGVEALFNAEKREVQLYYTNTPKREGTFEIKSKEERQLVSKRIGKVNSTDLKTVINKQIVPSINVNDEMYIPIDFLKMWGTVNKNMELKEYSVVFIPTQAPIFLNANEDLFKTKAGNFFGFANNLGLMKIQPMYEDAGQFHNGLAAVKTNGKWGYINFQGKMIIAPMFDKAFSFNENSAIVAKEISTNIYQYGLIDKYGNFILEPSFGKIREFKEELAAICIGNPNMGKWGFINEKGTFVIPPSYLAVNDFLSNYTTVKNNNGMWQLIDDENDIVDDEEYVWASSYASDMMLVDNGEEKYYCNKRGKKEVEYEDVFGDDDAFDYNIKMNSYKNSFFTSYNDNEVCVYREISEDGTYQYGLMDEDGDIVKKPFASYIYEFKDGYAIVRFGDESNGKFGIIDMDGDIVVSPIYDKIENVYLNRFYGVLDGKVNYIERY